MIINRRFIFALVLLCLARPVHTSAELLTRAEIAGMPEQELWARLGAEDCHYPWSKNCEMLSERLNELSALQGSKSVIYD